MGEEAIYYFTRSCGNGDVNKNEGCGSTTLRVTLAILAKAKGQISLDEKVAGMTRSLRVDYSSAISGSKIISMNVFLYCMFCFL